MGLFKKKDKEKKERKKLGETKVGIFLKEKAPELLGDGLQLLGGLTGRKVLENLGKKISGSDKLSDSDKAYALELIALDLQEMQEITARWESDNQQELKLPKLIRPVILAYTWIILTLLVVLDACGIKLHDNYVNMFEVLALTVNGAYFSARTVEKYHKMKHSLK